MPSMFNRTTVLIYGIISYAVGVAGLVSIIAAVAQLVPFGFLNPSETTYPILWNLVLVALWGLIHSVMARKEFKDWITKFIPAAAERSTYVLVAGVTSLLLIGLWQAVPGVIWSVENPCGGSDLDCIWFWLGVSPCVNLCNQSLRPVWPTTGLRALHQPAAGSSQICQDGNVSIRAPPDSNRSIDWSVGDAEHDSDANCPEYRFHDLYLHWPVVRGKRLVERDW